MQLLYALDVMKPEKPTVKDPTPTKKLLRQIDQTRALIVYILYNLVEIARYAEGYAKKRAAKNIVTQEDLAFNIKIAGNEIVWKILENNAYNDVLSIEKIEHLADQDFIKKMFLELIQTDEYQQYTALQSREKKSETQIMTFIFSDLLLASESFLSKLEERFPNWDDDGEMAEQMVMQYLNKPQSMQLQDAITKDKWEYAEALLETVIEKDDYLMDLIKPKLKNWDSDRIALIDMILLKMGVSELLYFETIPTKVTINEYIDIAKDYSTKQSGQFVNGILDSIHKDLISQDKIQKTDYRKK